MPDREIVLASASAVRARLLAAAGVPHRIEPARVDEAGVRAALTAEGAMPDAIAETLAELKAQQVARRNTGEIVVGADQVLVCGDRLFEKPADAAALAGHLRALAGRAHQLLGSVCAVRDGEVLWHHNARATLHMRTLGEDFIADYVARTGESARHSVGGYELEGLGVQLFERIEGDYFTILGLPLLPLLAFLRTNGILAR